MPSTTYSAAILGIEARLVTVEADSQHGLPRVTIVGLPDAAVQEARERIRSAMKNSGFLFPYGHVTFNLSPADWKKEGSGFDLPAALALLVTTDQLPDLFADYIVIGELSLAGDVRPATGILAMAELARRLGKKLLVPAANAWEAKSIDGVVVTPIKNLRQIMGWISGGRSWPEQVVTPIKPPAEATWSAWPSIRAQTQAKRAIIIAAAGHHNVLMVGPPGSGKTLLAQGLRELLPPLNETEALAVTKIHSVAGRLAPGQSLVFSRPFRQPHHTASVASLVGGGRIPKPGELSLAHHGVLFLDEFSEFSREHIEALRQPLEDGVVTVSRVAGSTQFPASCMLVAAMNPCPCGWLHDRQRPCRCSPALIARYQRRLSGPILDRFDLFVHVPRVTAEDLRRVEERDDPRQRILATRQRQRDRSGTGGVVNSRLTGQALAEVSSLGPDEQDFIRAAMEKMHFSMRAYHRLLRVSRTIADLAEQQKITTTHLAEAIQYRPPFLIGPA